MKRFAWTLSLLTCTALASQGCQLISGLDDLETAGSKTETQGMGGMQNSSGMPGPGSSGSSSSGGIAPNGLPVPFACLNSDSTVHLCMSFDSDLAADESVYAHQVTPAGLIFQPGSFGRAAGFTQGSSVSIPTDEWLALTQFTIEAWIFLNADASGQMNPRVIFHSPNQLGFAVDKDGKLRCGVMASGDSGFRDVNGPELVPIGQWVHVSCSFDGTNLELGQNLILIASSAPGPTTLAPASVPLMIGQDAAMVATSSLQGKLDHIRVHNVSYTMPVLCALYGKLC